MKAPTLIALVLSLASAAPALAFDSIEAAEWKGEVSILTGPSVKIDDDILHPIPKKKIPIPRPHCLSCPPDVAVPGLEEVVIPTLR